MRVSNNFNPDTAKALAFQIGDVIKRDPELTQGEILSACLLALVSTLMSIQCRDCRRLSAKAVKREMRDMIAAALATASGQTGSEHRH